MTTEKVKTGYGKYVWIIGVVSLIGLFTYLQSMGLEITCQDKVCEANEICDILCNVTNPTYKSVYLFNHDDWKITFNPNIVEANLYAKYYGKWRYTNFTRETRFSNIPEERKYVFVFPKKSTKEFKLEVIVKDTANINWNFGGSDQKIISYKIISEMISYEHYKNNKEFPTKKEVKNNPLQKVELEDETHSNANIEGNTLIKWNVPVGDRNFEQFGRCRDFEISNGVCTEVDLI